MNTANAFKLTQKVVAILSCFIVFMTSYPFYADATHASEGHAPIQQFASNVNFSKNFIVEWKVDHDSQSVEFLLNVTIDDKGWVLLGFLLASNDSYKPAQEDGLQGTNGDFVVTWFSSPGRTKTLDLNTIDTGKLQPDGNSTELDYHVTVEHFAENSSDIKVLRITRKLDTEDPLDVPITDQPMWIAGAYGNSEVYLTDLSNITAGGLDTLTFKKVIILRETTKNNSKKPWHKVIQEQVRKHWIGVVIGVAGLLTVVIVAAIYLSSKRGKEKVKKVKMTFYKDDEDDEAKVAFLHSRT